MRCAVCGRATPSGADWCPLLSSLVCSDCCRGLRDVEPDRVVEFLSTATMALDPARIESACEDCMEGRRGAGRGAPGTDLPS